MRMFWLTVAVVLLLQDLRLQSANLEAVLKASGGYLAEYERRIAAVVLEERYLQGATHEIGGGPPDSRLLRSDVLVIADQEFGWVGFRDVFEVDGRPVRDREERLAKLFLNRQPDAVEHARHVIAESARYNLNSGPIVVERSINLPMTALRFLTIENQPRSTFRNLGMKTLDGKPALVLEFRERARPRIIRTLDDAAVEGRIWLDPDTAAIMRTEIWFDTVNPRFSAKLTIRLRVSFAPNEKLGMWLPASMEEEYVSGRSRLFGHATYEAPRRFAVTTTEQIK